MCLIIYLNHFHRIDQIITALDTRTSILSHQKLRPTYINHKKSGMLHTLNCLMHMSSSQKKITSAISSLPLLCQVHKMHAQQCTYSPHFLAEPSSSSSSRSHHPSPEHNFFPSESSEDT